MINKILFYLTKHFSNHPLNTEQGDDKFLITDELDERDDSVNCSEDRVTQSGKNVASTGFKFRKTKAKINKVGNAMFFIVMGVIKIKMLSIPYICCKHS